MASTPAAFVSSALSTAPVGAQVLPGGGVRFRVWAPASRQVAVVLATAAEMTAATQHPLEPEAGGYWTLTLPEAQAGMHYLYQLDSGRFSDPASRFQPLGPHGPSRIVDAAFFAWTDAAWTGVSAIGQVIYELHIGTFTPEGTWAAAAEQLPHLADLGVTLVEVMPVADFPGRFGWGYDGVNLFAPTRLYGEPDDFRRFVDRAHALGLGVILDVVYNHLGPDGNYLRQFAPQYFNPKHHTDWGDALNFDGRSSGPVREFFLANAVSWITEYHCDGLRLDATQAIFDDSAEPILAVLSQRVKQAAAGRGVYIIGENEPQNTRLVRPIESGGFALDSIWNDDFHHSAVVAMTGSRKGYFTDYRGAPQEFVSALKRGFLYQGQHYQAQQARRGTPALDLAPSHFVSFLQNHDQVANALWGRRTHTLASAAKVRALTAVLLLGPATPMLFQGQEFAASAPFLYFADHQPELAALVRKGRAAFMGQFPNIAEARVAELALAPECEETFRCCKLDFSEREKHAPMLRLHRDLLRLRREHTALQGGRAGCCDGAVLGAAAWVLRFFGSSSLEDRLLVVNLGGVLHLDVVPEPLLAPPAADAPWSTVWSSDAPSYAGTGQGLLETDGGWTLPAESAVLLAPAQSVA